MRGILREAPLFQEILEEGEEIGLEKGRQEGRQEGLRQAFVKLVQARFPSPKLVRLAKGQVAMIENPAKI